MKHPRSWRPTRRVHSRQHHVQGPSYRPAIVALEDRVLPAPIAAVFTLDSTNSTLSLSTSSTIHYNSPSSTCNIAPQGTGALTTHYSGTLAATWDLATSTIQLLSTGTSLTAATNGSWSPGPGGTGGPSAADFGFSCNLSFPLGQHVNIVAALRNLTNVLSSTVLSLSGSGGTYHFPGNSGETVHFNAGSADYSYSGAASGHGSANLANINSGNNAGQGTLQDLGGGNFRLTIPVAQTTTSNLSSGSLTLISSGTLVANVALGFGVTGFPNPVTAGTTGSVTVTAKIGGATNTGYRGTIHFSSNDTQAGLPADYTFTAADNGVHTFGNVVLKTAGSRSVTVSDTANSGITGSQAVTVNPAAATSLTLAGFPTPITAGTAGNATVTLKDPYGNTATGYTGTVHFTSSDTQAVVPNDYAFTAGDAGVHVFSITLKTAATQSITATDRNTSSITGTQSGITVNPATASSLTATGFPSPVTAGTPGNLTVTLKDLYGNIATGYTGTVHFTSSDARAVLPTDYVFTAGDQGVHVFSITLKTAATQSITATDTNNGSITGTQSGITVNPAAVSMLLVSGFPFSTVAGTAGTVTVTATDAYGNTVPTYAGTVTFSSSDPQASLPADSTLTMGTGMFSATLFTAGSQSITATDTVTTSLSGSQSGISVSPAALDHLSVTTSADSTGTVAGTAFDVTVTAQDAYNNTVTSYTGTVTFSSGDPYGAILPADYTFQPSDMGQVTLAAGATLLTAGVDDVTATDTGNPALTASDFVNVVAAPATSLFVIAPTDVTSGAPFDLTVEALDPYGNIDTNYGGTVTFTTTDLDPGVVLPLDYTFQPGIDNGVVTFTDTGRGETTLVTPGLQTITVTDTVDGTITGSADVMVDPATNVPGGLNHGPALSTSASSSSASSPVTPVVMGAGSTAAQPVTSVSQTASVPTVLPHAVDNLFVAFPDALALDGNLGINTWGRTF